MPALIFVLLFKEIILFLRQFCSLGCLLLWVFLYAKKISQKRQNIGICSNECKK